MVRIYTFKAGLSVTTGDGDNPVRTHGGNACWKEIGTREYEVTMRNLLAARNAEGNLSYCVFTSACLGERTINDVIRGLLGASFPAGEYEF